METTDASLIFGGIQLYITESNLQILQRVDKELDAEKEEKVFNSFSQLLAAASSTRKKQYKKVLFSAMETKL